VELRLSGDKIEVESGLSQAPSDGE